MLLLPTAEFSQRLSYRPCVATHTGCGPARGHTSEQRLATARLVTLRDHARQVARTSHLADLAPCLTLLAFSQLPEAQITLREHPVAVTPDRAFVVEVPMGRAAWRRTAVPGRKPTPRAHLDRRVLRPASRPDLEWAGATVMGEASPLMRCCEHSLPRVPCVRPVGLRRRLAAGLHPGVFGDLDLGPRGFATNPVSGCVQDLDGVVQMHLDACQASVAIDGASAPPLPWTRVMRCSCKKAARGRSIEA